MPDPASGTGLRRGRCQRRVPARGYITVGLLSRDPPGSSEARGLTDRPAGCGHPQSSKQGRRCTTSVVTCQRSTTDITDSGDLFEFPRFDVLTSVGAALHAALVQAFDQPDIALLRGGGGGYDEPDGGQTDASDVMAPHIGRPQDDSAAPPLTSEATIDLLELVKIGDRTALNRLLERCIPPLRRWAHGRLPPAARGLHDTGDVVQETVIAA